MGWFRRGAADGSGGPDDGLYRGDAPVFMPGAGDDAPRAYQAGRTAADWSPPADPPAEPPAPPGSAPGPPPSWQPPPEWQPPPGWQPPAGWPPPPGPGSAPPVAAARRRRGPGAGCGLIAVLVIFGVVGLVAFGIFRAVQTAIPDRAVPDTRTGTVDAPVTVAYDDAQLRLTVTGAQAQPGGGWDDETGRPTLLVAMTIDRVDDGSAQVHVPFIDWSFTPSDGTGPVDVDIVSGFEPDLTSVTLGAGESATGFLAFETPATGGRLELAGDRYDDPPLVAWELAATPAAPVAGVLGEPVQPQIGRPPFTVTLTSTAWADQAGVDAWQPPASGSFLVADLTLTSAGGDGSEWVDSSAFVFVPTGGAAIPVVAADVVSSAESFAAVPPGGSAPIRAVFDAATGPGALELRDAGGRTMVSWPVS